MARARAGSHYVCQSCAAAFPRWEGQCRACGAWNSLVETLLPSQAVRATRQRPLGPVPGPVALRALGREPLERLPVGMPEVDRVLGGGLVPGSLLVLGGEPGVGKSTLLLQVAAGVVGSLARRSSAGSAALSGDPGPRTILYATGEESGPQLHLRAERLGLLAGPGGDGIEVLASTDAESVVDAAERLRPGLLVVDSIQTLSVAGLEGPAGSVGQVREAAARLGELARGTGVPVVLVGHVTKDGALAGPRTLEHLVDVVLMLEGDRTSGLRLLRGLKNRHGSTEEVGVLEMTSDGLRDVEDAARAFLGEGLREAPGLAIAAIAEGSRSLLVEVQALVAPAGLGPPRRTASGIDGSRIALLIAVLARRAGVDLGSRDVYASLAGGASVDEPALDLPLALALASSMRDVAIPAGTVCFGEVSLLGEVRPVAGAERRLREAERLGFRRAIVPRAPAPRGRPGEAARGGSAGTLEVVPVRTLRDALEAGLTQPTGTSGGEAGST